MGELPPRKDKAKSVEFWVRGPLRVRPPSLLTWPPSQTARTRLALSGKNQRWCLQSVSLQDDVGRALLLGWARHPTLSSRPGQSPHRLRVFAVFYALGSCSAGCCFKSHGLCDASQDDLDALKTTGSKRTICRCMPQVVKLRRRYPAVSAPRTSCANKAVMPAVKLRVSAARDRAGFPSGSCLHFWCCGGLYSDSRDVSECAVVGACARPGDARSRDDSQEDGASLRQFCKSATTILKARLLWQGWAA